ncbi:Glycosyltransferase AER61 [Macleaya cordata]|uniref:Glycosyltransferase AER61 n=1 Tax=Macleaya cordata TaxID=56857 RepID=A0A200QUY2_MACCD|nr:Glycosyltransferase AER61 [Macleaya cordata]
MEYDAIFAKSFSKNEQKKFGYGALIALMFIALTSFTVFKPSFSNLPILNLQLSIDAGLRMLMIEDTSSPVQRSSSEILKQEINKVANSEMKPSVCNVLEPRSDFCELDGDIRIDGNSSTVLFTSSQNGIFMGNESWRIRPYPRKGDNWAMKSVNELSVKSFLENDKQAPDCDINHNVPAVIFSIGGYAGNQFHDFSEVLVPLFVTSQQFHQEVQFLVTDTKPYWISKYEPILKQLSRYPIIDIDKENNIHCYRKVIVGLKYHKDIGIDPLKSPKGYSMMDFAQFLRNSYALKRSSAINAEDLKTKKPRLLLVSRKRTRRFSNEAEIANMAKNLGYEVIVAEPGVTATSLRFAHIVNSCDVMMGVHGAGLTNLLFLPTNAILIQIIPLGGLEWFAKHCYGDPAEAMNLRYLEYKIREEESTLIEQYPIDHAVFKDPLSFSKQGWGAVKSVYLDQQNVKLDVGRLRATLLEALELLHH